MRAVSTYHSNAGYHSVDLISDEGQRHWPRPSEGFLRAGEVFTDAETQWWADDALMFEGFGRVEPWQPVPSCGPQCFAARVIAEAGR